MSDELRLPDRLAACEAELASQPLAASTINRDELLYRAGWAAAESELASRDAGVLPSCGVRRAVVAAWSAASAALAASIAVAATLSLTGADHLVAKAPRLTLPDVATVTDEPPAADDALSPRQRVLVDPLLARLDALANGTARGRGDIRNASVWTATRRPRLGRSDQPILVTTDAASITPTGVRSATARELLDQLLPGRAKGTTVDGDSSGVLNLLRPLGWGGDTI